jgi:hypothetical protein
MHRFSSLSAESAGLTRRADPLAVPQGTASILYGMLTRPTERNAVRTDDYGDSVENLCMIQARG